ncbi:MAG: TrbI/VirB10 family protein [Pseudomonadota bacterium]
MGATSRRENLVWGCRTRHPFGRVADAYVQAVRGQRHRRMSQVVAFGQRRALVVWQRIILPDGSSLTLDNVPATDPSGFAGLADEVDFHTWSLLKGVVLSTVLGVGSNLTFSGESDLVQAIRESTQQNASRAGDQLTSRNLQVQPTITIRPGAPVRLIVHRDLVLAPWLGQKK